MGIASRNLIDSALARGALNVSAFTFWEVAMLTAKKRMALEWPVDVWRRMVLSAGVEEIPVSGEIAILSTALDGLPADPADRIIAATAVYHGGMLLTADQRILDWSGDLMRQDTRI